MEFLGFIIGAIGTVFGIGSFAFGIWQYRDSVTFRAYIAQQLDSVSKSLKEVGTLNSNIGDKFVVLSKSLKDADTINSRTDYRIHENLILFAYERHSSKFQDLVGAGRTEAGEIKGSLSTIISSIDDIANYHRNNKQQENQK